MKIGTLSKTYNGRVVLEIPAVELPDAGITAVIGPNGSGKSTLAKILAGIVKPDGGVNVLPGCRVGYLPQKSYAFRMSTEKNILLGGRNPVRAQQLMRALQIESLAKQNAKRLSGGETAKMALCRLLMGRYDLLLLDEPTAAMDMESTLSAEKMICKHVKEQGCSVLLITHSLQQARRMAEHVLFLYQGKLVEQGSADHVLRNPQQIVTKQFLNFYGMQ